LSALLVEGYLLEHSPAPSNPLPQKGKP